MRIITSRKSRGEEMRAQHDVHELARIHDAVPVGVCLLEHRFRLGGAEAAARLTTRAPQRLQRDHPGALCKASVCVCV